MSSMTRLSMRDRNASWKQSLTYHFLDGKGDWQDFSVEDYKVDSGLSTLSVLGDSGSRTSITSIKSVTSLPEYVGQKPALLPLDGLTEKKKPSSIFRWKSVCNLFASVVTFIVGFFILT